MLNKEFNDAQKSCAREKILNEIRGRMREEIVLIETKRALGRGYEVFRYQFIGGEFDMVVYDKTKDSCALYEIRHSREVVRKQSGHLLNEENCAIFEKRIAPIQEKHVLYRGDTCMTDWGIEYLNVEEYLIFYTITAISSFGGADRKGGSEVRSAIDYQYRWQVVL